MIFTSFSYSPAAEIFKFKYNNIKNIDIKRQFMNIIFLFIPFNEIITSYAIVINKKIYKKENLFGICL